MWAGYAELYDPALGTFRVLAAPREKRRDHTATRLPSGKVLIAAGYANAQSIASAEIYDPATDTWSAVADLATARRLFTATLLPDGTVLAAGGHYIPPASQGATYNLASAELYGLAVRRVLPATGPLAGGTSITITGRFRCRCDRGDRWGRVGWRDNRRRDDDLGRDRPAWRRRG